MPRRARVVVPGVPHHLTQRGVRRQAVFFGEDDYRHYLQWYRAATRELGIQTHAYCLMPNHVHLVAVPPSSESFARLFVRLHVRYARWLNRRMGWTGHVWQARYFSCPLDDLHACTAVRYVELNPVRAGLAATAEHYPWSSAAGHCGLHHDALLSTNSWAGIQPREWLTWLCQSDDVERTKVIREATKRDLPAGHREFVDALGSRYGRSFHLRPPGNQGGRREKLTNH
ncbi:MAG: transposase [Deltaproteobacteria bacterium]|nr:transposase [Deltaproteobacteria bacterium]